MNINEAPGGRNASCADTSSGPYLHPGEVGAPCCHKKYEGNDGIKVHINSERKVQAASWGQKE